MEKSDNHSDGGHSRNPSGCSGFILSLNSGHTAMLRPNSYGLRIPVKR